MIFLKGLVQYDRYKKETLPSFVKVDGRSLADLLQFVSQYANLIKFFSTNNINSENESDQNWSSFFNRDNLIILVSISNYNITPVEDYVQDNINKAHNTKDEGLRINILNELIKSILTIGESLDYIRKHVQRDELTSDLIFDISNAIQGDLRPNLMSLYQYKITLNWDESY